MGLEINETNDKCLVVSRNPYNVDEYVNICTYNLEKVKDCSYISTVLTNRNEWRSEIGEGTTNANSACYALIPALISTCSRKNKHL